MGDAAEYVVDLHDVEKVYRRKIHALRGIRMQVHPGQVFGLLGPNGAGKSTLVKIMMTVIRPTRVEGTLLGRPVGHKPTLDRVGYLPEHHRFPEYLTAHQVLDFYAALANVDRATRRTRSDELLELVGMADWRDHRIGSFSKGMRQRVGIAQALMNDPRLIVLDEPTDGVDPVGRADIRDVLLRLRDEGATIFVNSHLLGELEMVCDRVAILVQGKVVMQGTLDDLTADSRRYEIIVRGAAPGWIGDVDGMRSEDLPGDRSRLAIPGDDETPVQAVIDRLRADDTVIRSIRPVRESLEELFMRAVTDDTTGAIARPGAKRPASKGRSAS